ncbi:MAG TPA: tetratricopeptide repeat protein [Nitrospiraceae bacterium]|nr:tetratricopeptide repeat protein [Nitrospiraceae bacterium]
MPYRIKIDSKDTFTDEAHLLSGMERLGLRLQQYQWPIVIGFLVILAAAAAVGIVIWLDHRNTEQAIALEQQATRLYLDRPVDQPGKADENLRKAIALYQQTIENYPRSSIAPLALYRLGNALVQANDLDGAIKAYQRFVAMYGDSTSLLSLVYQRLGYVYLLKGDAAQAGNALSAVLGMPEAFNKDQVLFELGKIEEAHARPEGALVRYQELMKAYPNSPFAGEAAVRAKALEVKKGPEPATGTSEATPPLGGGTKGTTKEDAGKTKP